MSRTNHQIWTHVVWNTKNSENYFSLPFWTNYLNPLFFKIAHEKKIDLHFVNGYKNHVHALIKVKPNQSLSSLVKLLKGISSRRINEELGINHFQWQTGYYVSSVSPNRLEIAIKYIVNQWEKHQSIDFEQELKIFDFDEKIYSFINMK
ncbi:IS200/IS605 family transposase [Flammeovirga yaeyamensis]|uniref:IS200/IS605 family transposase n=1 Tax=Flammeovirga yaeyamensis TaxID=367791 RepID=A0AAX1NCV6_9BACT|nr:IS200/IS605 family transposase [Flammeovirga yaeyamensis]MBB3699359.1 putative transposase [Flammeovirga yaeyamensis]NMF35381.1 IS200/IS605 family transposase [Flammeovirga yaeyamensis]QWG04241.1 IS200/IS605 family transposase [Flammeovirga yaeyamensis]